MKKDFQNEEINMDLLCEQAHLLLSDAEKKRIGAEIDNILKFVSSVPDADLPSTDEKASEIFSRLREDVSDEGYPRERMTESFCVCDRGMPYVVRVVEGD